MLRAQLGEWRCFLLVARLCTPSDQPSRLPRRQSRVVGRGHEPGGTAAMAAATRPGAASAEPRGRRPREAAPSRSDGGTACGHPYTCGRGAASGHERYPRADRRACVCHGCGPERCRRCRPDRARASVARSRAASAAWPCRRAAMSGVGVRWSQVRSVKQRSSPPWRRQSQSGLYRDSNIHLDGRIEPHHQKWLRAECGPGRHHILI
jgi:hypothetical protein